MSVTAFDRKYRPKRLSDILGQGPVVAELRQFVEQPCSAGFLFVGESGIGKSSTAEALAAELDCSPSERTTIPSGQLDGDTLLWVEKMLRYAPMSGWRVVVFEEADLMTVKAERVPTPEEIAVEFIANMPRYTIQPATAVIAAQFNADPAVVATAIKARKWA